MKKRRDYQGCGEEYYVGKNITWEKGTMQACRGSNIFFPFTLRLPCHAGKNIKWGRVTSNLGKKIKIENMGVGEVK